MNVTDNSLIPILRFALLLGQNWPKKNSKIECYSIKKKKKYPKAPIVKRMKVISREAKKEITARLVRKEAKNIYN